MCCMVFYKPLHGAFYNVADVAAFGVGRFFKNILEVERNGADEVDRVLVVVGIVFDVTAEEGSE